MKQTTSLKPFVPLWRNCSITNGTHLMQLGHRPSRTGKNIEADCGAIITISDLLGKKLLEKNIKLNKGNSTIEIKHQLPDGIYLISLLTSQANLNSSIIVQKQ